MMLDRDLAALYNVETRALKQAGRRNTERFPADFIFELTAVELQDWRSQFVTSSADKMALEGKIPPAVRFRMQGGGIPTGAEAAAAARPSNAKKAVVEIRRVPLNGSIIVCRALACRDLFLPVRQQNFGSL